MQSNRFGKGEGFTDFILLDNPSEDSFMANLKQRFDAGHIYTYIGEQVVSVNPFRKMDKLYGPAVMENYKRMYMYEVPPHIYAMGDDVYRSLMQSKDNQCVIITGESGAGKTEASKIFMQYLTAISANRGDGDNIKKKLLDSNPLLEAFGNSKTLRNDNSSRFGKYMEILFDGAGAPVGGRVLQYLLEKSRVVTRAEGERSFHVFYQLLSDSGLVSKLSIGTDASSFKYLALSKCYKVDTIDDSADFVATKAAMSSLSFKPAEQEAVFRVLAGILLLGNVEYTPDTAKTTVDAVVLKNPDVVKKIASLLDCDEPMLKDALIQRTITSGAGHSRESNISVFLDEKQAYSTRDSLAKGLYDSVFNYVVKRINADIKAIGKPELQVGVLDIYGFEVFDNNSFEQFCINYCNEKLQQLFIKLVLKQEQEEYAREGIEWTEIDYFNNQPICALIEATPAGIYAFLDEQCLLGNSTPESFLEKLNSEFGRNNYFENTAKDKTLPRSQFRIKHYAGPVNYEVAEFLSKNRDTLFGDLLSAVRSSRNSHVKDMFPDLTKGVKDMKRPPTIGFQFKGAVDDLINKLNACQPHYIRCIKSNDNKRGGQFDETRVRHQVRYLNLVETVRVRRAGFCSRQPYERFLARYKLIAPKTWPIWRGSVKDGSNAVLQHLKVEAAEFRLGKTKVFIRSAKTLFLLEEARAREIPKVAIKMQKVWKGYKTRKWFKIELENLRKEKAAAEARRRLVEKANKIQRSYINWRTRRYIQALSKTFGNVAKDKPDFGRGRTIPPFRKSKRTPVDDYIQKIHLVWWGRAKVESLSESDRALVRQKILCSDLYQKRKPWNPQRSFKGDYLGRNSDNERKDKFHQAVQKLFQTYGDTMILFADDVNKVNSGLKAQLRTLIVTEQSLYKYDPKKYTIRKKPVPLQKVQSIKLSTQKDGYVIIEMQAPERDLVLDLGMGEGETASELAVVLFQLLRDRFNRTVPVTFGEPVPFNNSRTEKAAGVEVKLTFGPNPKPSDKGAIITKVSKTEAKVLF